MSGRIAGPRTQRCARCNGQERIPTHQHVKFDLVVHDLCAECWRVFRAWFFAGKVEEGPER